MKEDVINKEVNMKNKKYIGIIDIGTTTIKFILFNLLGEVVSEYFSVVKQKYPQYGWVEEDPIEIWNTTENVIVNAINDSIYISKIVAIGICNQRESTMIWDCKSGKPLSNLIVWQDRRTSDRCLEIKKNGLEDSIKQRTGLIVDPYFSSTKLEWILQNSSLLKNELISGRIKFGTVDSWIVYKLTGKHLTDVSNASRTMLFNISSLLWDEDLLKIFNIPTQILPEVLPSFGNAIFGYTKKDSVFKKEIPICAILGDQQSALFGQRCFSKGDIKSTYGTGAFLMVNTGEERIFSKNNLLTTIFYESNNKKINYALEASIYNAGSVFQWLKEGLKLIKEYKEIRLKAADICYNDKLFFVPAFTGLGAPFWDPYARGMIIGLTRDTNDRQIIRASLEALAYRTRDVVIAMEKDANLSIEEIKIDGGVSRDPIFCEILADLTGIKIKAFKFGEFTALGTMYAAAIGSDLFNSIKDIKDSNISKEYIPNIEKDLREKLHKRWRKALSKTLHWDE